MRRKWGRLSAVIVSMALTVGLSVGCSNSTSINKEQEISEKSETQTTATDNMDNSGDKKEVTLWHYLKFEAEALEKAADMYNKSQNKVHVNCTYMSRDELMKQYTIGAVSGELPDIGIVDSPDMASYISLGVFEEIDDELQEWGELDKFFEGPLNSCKNPEGKLYGLPNNSNCLALLCNMDLINAAGFDNPPATWEEFYEVCKATADADNSIYGFSMSAIGNEEATFHYIPWLYSAGGSVTNLNAPEAAESLNFLGKLVSEKLMSKEVVNWGQDDALNAFIAGKAAMVESGTWQVGQIDSGDVTLDFNYQYAMLPKNKTYASVIGGENFGICTGTEAKQECIDFLKFIMTAENNADWCEMAGKLPVRSDAMELRDIWTKDERYAVFSEAMNYAVARGPHESWPTISEAIYTAEQTVLLGEKSGEEAMDIAASVVNPILQEVPIAQ